MNVRSVLLAATAALALPSLALPSLAAQAEQAPKPAAATALPSCESRDGHGGGATTRPEVTVRAPELAKRVVHCDADRDRKLSREECAACDPAVPERPRGD